jgi:D-sedoheptulose 7-phosphate isomerase
MNWSSKVNEIDQHLKRLSALGSNNETIPIDKALDLWVDLALSIREKQNTIFLIGNGASASMASHVAADLAKNGHVHTEVFSDLSLITAIANDISYEEVFADPLRRRIRKGDMLVAISSSGQSMNVLKAADEAEKLGGTLVTLSAMRPDNPLLKKGFLNFYIPAMTYGLAETCHAAVLHYWIDKIVERNSTENK